MSTEEGSASSCDASPGGQRLPALARPPAPTTEEGSASSGEAHEASASASASQGLHDERPAPAPPHEASPAPALGRPALAPPAAPLASPTGAPAVRVAGPLAARRRLQGLVSSRRAGRSGGPTARRPAPPWLLPGLEADELEQRAVGSLAAAGGADAGGAAPAATCCATGVGAERPAPTDKLGAASPCYSRAPGAGVERPEPVDRQGAAQRQAPAALATLAAWPEQPAVLGEFEGLEGAGVATAGKEAEGLPVRLLVRELFGAGRAAQVRIRRSKLMSKLMDAATAALGLGAPSALCFSVGGCRLAATDTPSELGLEEGAEVGVCASAACAACAEGAAAGHGAARAAPAVAGGTAAAELGTAAAVLPGGLPAGSAAAAAAGGLPGRVAPRRDRAAPLVARPPAAPATWEQFRAAHLPAMRAQAEERWQRLSADGPGLQLLAWRHARLAPAAGAGSALAASVAGERLAGELDALIAERCEPSAGAAAEADVPRNKRRRTGGAPAVLESLGLDSARVQSPLLVYLELCLDAAAPAEEWEERASGALQRWLRLEGPRRAALWSIVHYRARLQDRAIAAYVADRGRGGVAARPEIGGRNAFELYLEEQEATRGPGRLPDGSDYVLAVQRRFLELPEAELAARCPAAFCPWRVSPADLGAWPGH